MNKLLKLFNIILIGLSYFSYSGRVGIYLGYYFQFIVGAILVGINMIVYRINKNTIKRKTIEWLIIPELLTILVSLIIWIGNDLSTSYFTRFMSDSLFIIISVCSSIALFFLYKEESVDLIFYGSVFNYLIVIMVFIKENGLNILKAVYLNIVENDSTSTVLEAHQVTFVFACLLIYYLLKSPKKDKKKILLCSIFLVMGFKRILIAALLVALICSFVLTKFKNNKAINNIYFIIFIVILLISYGWVYIVKSGFLNEFSEKYSIDFMSRLIIYDTISYEYKFDIFYFGKGLGFTSKWMQLNAGAMKIHSNIGLHSDILKKYIEYGFIVFGIYIYSKSYFITKKISNISVKNSIIYMTIFILTEICWLTDNLAEYFTYVLCFNIIYLALSNEKDKMKIEEDNFKNKK